MKLYQMFEAKKDQSVPAEQVVAEMKKQLPGMEVTRLPRYDEIDIDGSVYEFLVAMRLMPNQRQGRAGILQTDRLMKKIEREAAKLAAAQGEEYYDEYGEWESFFAEALHNKVKEGLKRFLKHIPEGWRFKTYVFNPSEDPVDPFFEIRLERDVGKPSSSRHTAWYHVTLLHDLPSIRRHGLTPRDSARSLIFGTYKNRIFLFPESALKHKLDRVKEIVRNLQSEALGGIYGFVPPKRFKHIALLKVELPRNVPKWVDEDAREVNGIYIEQPIPPENIKIAYTGPIKDMHL